MRSPKLKNYRTLKVFFADFVSQNKAANAAHSYRYLAKKLKWPASYLNDLIAERKPLTIARAVQFANVAGLTPLETEYLITMAMAESPEDQVREHFTRRLREDFSQPQFQNVVPSEEDQYAYFELLFVAAVIEWRGQLPNPSVLKKWLYGFPELTTHRIAEIIDYLIEKAILTVDRDGKAQLTGTLTYEAPPSRDYLVRLRRRIYKYLEDSDLHLDGETAMHGTAVGSFPLALLPEAQQKIQMLRNWFVEQSNVAVGSSRPPSECLPLMLHLSLVSIIDKTR